VPDPITLLRQASPRINVRAWHNRGPGRYGGTAAHTTIEIAWADDGGPEYIVGRQHIALPRGVAMVVPAGVEHTTYIAEGVRAQVLGLKASVVEEVADAMSVRAALQPTVSAARPRLLALGRLIFDEALEQTAGCDVAIDAMTEALAVELVRTRPAEPKAERRPADPRIRRAVEYIDASFAAPLSIDAVAKVATMSRFYFGRVFEEQVGKSPYRYLVDVRVRHAAAMLRRGRVSVTEAALSVGFNDLGRFGRAFRARYGVSPREALAASRARGSGARTPLRIPGRASYVSPISET
jgi:AraC family transcriptional regulator